MPDRPYTPEALAERFLRWLKRLFRKPAAASAQPAITHVSPPTNAPTAKRGERRSVEDSKWVFRGAILDRLDEYFYCIGKLRRIDPDAYAIFSRIGAAVPADRWRCGERLLGERPMAGAVTVTIGDTGDDRPENTVVASLLYFTKVSRLPFSVEKTDGDVYQVTVLWDDRDKAGPAWSSKGALAERCHLAVAADGGVRVLRERYFTPQRIPLSRHSTGRRRGGGASTVYHLRFGPPRWLVDMAAEKGRTVHQQGAALLLMAVGTWKAALDGVRIAVRRGPVTASFGIDLSRAPYFFADRDLEDGRRRKIFHAVRAHVRTRPNGRTSEVRAHYRGTRHFTWGGYEIAITKPGKQSLLTKDGPGAHLRDDDEPPPNEQMLGGAELGNFIDRAMNE